MNTLSIIVPCYNEEETLPFFFEAMEKVRAQLNDINMEYLFVDDGSKDRTYEKLVELNKYHPHAKYISFSRNFGKEAAIFAGLRAVTGDCCIVMDADLQHPPETIPKMYEKWLEGYEIVEGIKTDRGRESLIHKSLANLFYRMFGKVNGHSMKNTSDFKLLDRKAINTLSSLTERDTFFRALSWWIGCKTTSVEYEVSERVAGNSKWSFRALFRYAYQNLLSFSYIPLSFITFIGIIVLIIGFGFTLDAFISYMSGQAVSGYPTLVFLLMMATGAIMCSLGIMGMYIAKIYEQSKNRPQYIISSQSKQE